jgi:hypothetical protein
MHNEELHDLDCSAYASSRVINSRRTERKGRVGDERCTQVLVGIAEGTRQVGRLTYKWEHNIKMDIEWRGLD